MLIKKDLESFMLEFIDIYDASLRPLGKMERDEAHKKGQWHQTFHCWVINCEKQTILFQIRSKTTKTHPTKLDISAAGHIRSGESVEDGIRELEEELGLRYEIGDLIFAGKRVEVSDNNEKNVHNREYQSVYFCKSNLAIDDYNPDPEEVSGLAEIPLDESIRLFSGQVSEVNVRTCIYSKDGSIERNNRILKLEDFIPRIQNYYLIASIMGKRLAENQLPLAIS